MSNRSTVECDDRSYGRFTPEGLSSLGAGGTSFPAAIDESVVMGGEYEWGGSYHGAIRLECRIVSDAPTPTPPDFISSNIATI